jgi:NADPH:quinone reductase-like Zn-dependent oxidoreductase
MKRVIVDHFGGPEVLRVVEDDDPRPGPGEVRVRALAAGVSFTDAQLRAGPRDPDQFRADFRAVVAEQLPLSEARRAHEMLERSAAKGKLVLVP